MKVAMVVLSMLTTLLFSSVVFGAGQYEIRVTELDENKFSVALINSYSNYYDQKVEGFYASSTIAEQAGQLALDSYLSDGEYEGPDPCSHDINWM